MVAKILYQTTHGTEDPTRAGLTLLQPMAPDMSRWLPSSPTLLI